MERKNLLIHDSEAEWVCTIDERGVTFNRNRDHQQRLSRSVSHLPQNSYTIDKMGTMIILSDRKFSPPREWAMNLTTFGRIPAFQKSKTVKKASDQKEQNPVMVRRMRFLPSVQAIEYQFWGEYPTFENLYSAAFPSGVTSISKAVFLNCPRLSCVSVPKSAVKSLPEIIRKTEHIDWDGLMDPVEVGLIPDSWTLVEGLNEAEIKDKYYFYRLIPIDLTGYSSYDEAICDLLIGRGCLYACHSSRKRIVVPEHVTRIGSYAFAHCENLEEIILPDSVTEIDCAAFMNCKRLQHIRLPKHQIKIGGLAFEGTPWLQQQFAENNGMLIHDGLLLSGADMESVTIPAEVCEVGEYAFFGHKKMKKVFFQEGTKKISFGAFANCSSLQEISFADSLTDIGLSAFWGCSTLRELTLPANVECVHDHAFGKCKELSHVWILGKHTEFGTPFFHEDLLDMPDWHLDIMLHGYPGSTAEKMGVLHVYDFETIK